MEKEYVTVHYSLKPEYKKILDKYGFNYARNAEEQAIEVAKALKKGEKMHGNLHSES